MGKHYCIWGFWGAEKNAAAREKLEWNPTCTESRSNWGTRQEARREAEGRADSTGQLLGECKDIVNSVGKCCLFVIVSK